MSMLEKKEPAHERRARIRIGKDVDGAGEQQLELFHELIPSPPCGRRGCPRQVIVELVSVTAGFVTDSSMQLRCPRCDGVAPYRSYR